MVIQFYRQLAEDYLTHAYRKGVVRWMSGYKYEGLAQDQRQEQIDQLFVGAHVTYGVAVKIPIYRAHVAIQISIRAGDVVCHINDRRAGLKMQVSRCGWGGGGVDWRDEQRVGVNVVSTVRPQASVPAARTTAALDVTVGDDRGTAGIEDLISGGTGLVVP